MKPCKRIEIVIEQTLARRLAERLDQLGAPGYTVIHGVSGRGYRGLRQADEVTGTFTDSLFLIACPDELVSTLVDGVRPLLTRAGGICLVTDAQWLRH